MEMRRTIITLIIAAVLVAMSGCGQMPDRTPTSSTPSNTTPPDTGATISEPSPNVTPPETVLPTTGLGKWVRLNPLPSGESILSDTPEFFYTVWGSSSSDVFAVGTDGVIVHYDGVGWSNMNSGVNYDLYDIWGSSPYDVFAVGDKGTILHYDGTGWNKMDSGTNKILLDVSGSSPKDVFTISEGGTVLLYDGTSWHTAEFDLGVDVSCSDAWGSSSSNIFIANQYLGEIADIFYYNGIDWLPMNSGHPGIKGCVWGSSPTEVYAGAGNGTIVYFNGSQWITLLSDAETVFWGVWASSPSDIFAVGVHKIMHYDGTEWAIMYNDDSLSLQGVWGSSSEVFAVGSGGTILYYSSPSDDLIVDT